MDGDDLIHGFDVSEEMFKDVFRCSVLLLLEVKKRQVVTRSMEREKGSWGVNDVRVQENRCVRVSLHHDTEWFYVH